MSVFTVLYAVAMGLLLAAAAWCGERGLRRLGLPGRWTWLVAIGGTLAAPFAPGDLLSARGDASWALLDGVEVEAAAPSLGSEPPPVTALNQARPWIPVACGLLGFVGLGAILGGLGRLGRQARRWPLVRVDGEPILVSRDFGPAVLGLRRSRTVLPRWALELPAAELDLILRHERAHRRARDPQLLAAGVLAAALAPWNPALWLCVRGLRESVEKDCDRRVLRAGTDRLAYARMLVSMRGLAGRSSPAGPLPVPALAESPDSLERRLRTMWITPSRRPAVPALLAAAALLVVACESPSPTVTQPEPAQSSTVEASGALIEVQGTAEAPDPLIVVDGEVYQGAVSLLAPQDIDRVEVLKGEAAASIYGEAGADGVVRITTKAAAGTVEPKTSPDEAESTVRIRTRPSTGTFRVDPVPEGASGVLRQLDTQALGGALLFVDGVEVEGGLPASLDPDDIDRVEVIKGEAAANLFGSRASKGVVQIFTKGGGGR